MSFNVRGRAIAAVVLATAITLALAACIVAPGTFQSTLDLRKDGRFTFTYSGEIYLLALSQLTEMAGQTEAAEETFVEQPCYDEDLEERTCTEDELAEQRRQWDEQVETRKASAERDRAGMQAMLGGIDPSDPKAAEELAERLRRQEGWKRVDYRGEGLFEVEFSLTSRIGHDFSFPTFERFPMSNSFVVVNLRQGNTVRVEAPGFAAQGASGGPFQGMMGGMAGVFGAGEAAQSEEGSPKVPEINGTFRILTDGKVLANNTDQGPTQSAGGQVLEWQINRRTPASPMALVQLGS